MRVKSSRNLKVGVTLLVIALAVGVFTLVVWADGNGMYGMRGGSNGNMVHPRYGMQNKEFSNQMEMKTMTIADIATLWGIDAGKLLEEIKNEFELTQMYNIGSTIDDLRGEYRFSPYQIMEIVDRINS